MHKEIKDIIEACASELVFRTSRSGGAGGQHVNKVETKVTLRWDVKNSSGLTLDQKNRILERLSNKINKEGELLISDASSRSQLKNRQTTVRKWSRLINKAFYEPKRRKRSRPSKAAIARRRMHKERRSELKASRRWKGE